MLDEDQPVLRDQETGEEYIINPGGNRVCLADLDDLEQE